MSESIFELTNVRRHNGANVALDGISASMQPGEVLGVIGPNGAGKSTLMRVLLGLIAVHSGEVRVFGRDPRKHEVAVRQRIGYASDGQNEDSRATLGELQSLHRALYPNWDQQFAERLLGPLADKPKSRIDRLSRGESQRVRIALAMAHRPELLLLDEPGAGLDPSLRREFLEDAVGLLGEAETSVVINSHHLTDIERIASRVVLLQAGRVVLDAELDALRERYCLVTMDERQFQQACNLTSEDSVGETSPTQASVNIPDYVGHRVRHGEVRVVLNTDVAEAHRALERRGLRADVAHPNLEELYVVLVGGNQ